MADVPERYQGNARLLGANTLDTIRKAKLLVVGAGGIGCELLKTLVLTGFEDIQVIDLDTIDASNLNRQFLFRKGDVGKSKAEVAQRAAATFNPLANVRAHHGNIKDGKFGDEFFRSFDLVINALDNLDARKHVNRMCIKTDRPLIESGTRGYVGQVQPIQKGVFECYDCRPRHEERQYAYCTIRSSPTRMVHCVAFAKVLYEHLFGTPEDDDDPVQFAQLSAEAQQAGEKSSQALGIRLFNKLHHTTINDLLALEEKVWTTSKPKPTPLYTTFAAADYRRNPREILPAEEQATLFVASFVGLSARERTSFDKDDALAMDFISAVSNLRAHVFGIPLESQFDVKAIAGNIVPAIATTNAIISGTVVLEALKILAGRLQDCRMTFCGPLAKRFYRKPCILYPSELLPPDPKCYICSDRKKRLHILVDTTITTLGFFVREVLQKHLSFAEPLLDGPSGGIYDHEVHRGHAKLAKPLADLGIGDGAQLVATDALQDLELDVSIVHLTCNDPTEYRVEGDAFMATPPGASAAADDAEAATALAAALSDDDEVLEYVPKVVRREGKKRKDDEVSSSTSSAAKRPKAATEDVILLE